MCRRVLSASRARGQPLTWPEPRGARWSTAMRRQNGRTRPAGLRRSIGVRCWGRDGRRICTWVIGGSSRLPDRAPGCCGRHEGR
jgi:hypothetical protein